MTVLTHSLRLLLTLLQSVGLTLLILALMLIEAIETLIWRKP